MTSANAGSRDVTRRGYAAWLAADVVLISFFALLGHLSHYGTLSPTGIAGTAAPFLAAYLAVTAMLHPWRRTAFLLRTAIPLWIGTSAGGLLLRILFGESAALSFQVVAVCVLGLFLVTPRAIAALIRRRRVQPPLIHSPSHDHSHNRSHNQGAAS